MTCDGERVVFFDFDGYRRRVFSIADGAEALTTPLDHSNPAIDVALKDGIVYAFAAEPTPRIRPEGTGC